MRPVRPLSSLRDWRIGLPTSCVSVRASSGWRSTTSSRNLRMAARRFLIGVAAHFGCARARALVLRAHGLGVVGDDVDQHGAGRGIGDFHGLRSAEAKSFSKSAAVHLRGLVWWQMSAVAISTRRGMSPRCDGVAARSSRRASPECRSSALSCAEPGDERRAARFGAAVIAAGHARHVRELGELVGRRGQVEAHHVVDHDAVGQAVMHVGDRRQRVRARMHGAQVLLERDGAHHRAHQHVRARGEVAAVAHGNGQRARGDAHAFERDAVAQRMIGGRQVRLDVVRQRVHARGRGDERRQVERQLGIGEHGLGEQQRREDDLLDVRLVVGDDRRAADLRAGAGGRGQRDEVRHAPGRSARTCGWSHAYSRMSPGWFAISAMAFATSSAAPPPRPIDRVGPMRLVRLGARPSPACARDCPRCPERRRRRGRAARRRSCGSSGSAAMPRSVTRSGRVDALPGQVLGDELAGAGAEVNRRRKCEFMRHAYHRAVHALFR